MTFRIICFTPSFLSGPERSYHWFRLLITWAVTCTMALFSCKLYFFFFPVEVPLLVNLAKSSPGVKWLSHICTDLSSSLVWKERVEILGEKWWNVPSSEFSRSTESHKNLGAALAFLLGAFVLCCCNFPAGSHDEYFPFLSIAVWGYE